MAANKEAGDAFVERLKKMQPNKLPSMSEDDMFQYSQVSKLSLQLNNIYYNLPQDFLVNLVKNGLPFDETHLLQYDFTHSEYKPNRIPIEILATYHVTNAAIQEVDLPRDFKERNRWIPIHPYHLLPYSAKQLEANSFLPLTSAQLADLHASRADEEYPDSFNSHRAKLPFEETQYIPVFSYNDLKKLRNSNEIIHKTHLLLFDILPLRDLGIDLPIATLEELSQLDRDHYHATHIFLYSKEEVERYNLPKYLTIDPTKYSDEMKQYFHASHLTSNLSGPGNNQPNIPPVASGSRTIPKTSMTTTPSTNTTTTTETTKTLQSELRKAPVPDDPRHFSQTAPKLVKIVFDLRHCVATMQRLCMFTQHDQNKFGKTPFWNRTAQDHHKIFYPIPVADNSPFIHNIHRALTWLPTPPKNTTYTSLKHYHIDTVLDDTIQTNQQQWLNLNQDPNINNRKRKILYMPANTKVKIRHADRNKIQVKEEPVEEAEMEEIAQ